jgi:protein ATS1
MSHHLWVFGSNGEGQLGEGIPAADIVGKPTVLPQLPCFKEIKTIKSGDNHTLVQFNNDSVSGVGDNTVGQLDPSGQLGRRFCRFEKLRDSVSFFAATCESSALIECRGDFESTILTQGRGQWGELGRGEEETMAAYDLSTIAELQDRLPGRVIDFAAGVWHYVLLMADGTAYGWGKARLGQLGDNLSGKVSIPTKLENLPIKPTRVVCGKDFTYLAGDSSTGEHLVLGKDKFNIISAMPPDIKGWKDIGATWHAIFVLFNDGRLTVWGKENQWKPLPPDLPPIEKIAVGTDHILAVTKEGKLISWGWGKHGNCGDLSTVKQEIKNDMISGFWNEISIPGRIQKIAAGYCTSFVVTEVDDDQLR